MSRSDYTEHQCSFNTAGYCPTCGARVALPEPSTTAPMEPVLIITPFTLPGTVWPTETLPFIGDVKINGGSPVGPGFVVYERAPGYYGYDVKMARESIGPGWRHLAQALFDAIEHDKKWNPMSGFASMVVTQVKEKFGALRIYFHTDGKQQGGYDRVEGFVDALAAMSCKTCEACGSPALPVKERRPRSWVLSLCRTCDAKDATELRALFEQTEQSE